MKVKDILGEKGGAVHTIGPDAFISDAIQVLNKHKIGALLVMDEAGEILGILTERDILRLCERQANNLGQIPVRQEMTKDLLIGLPDDDVNYVMNIMTKNRIRHLPIVSEGRLAGMVSIGDVLKARLDQAEFETRHLHDYITGKYPG
ncbi:MAG: CBS domain-containing protein [bacterium]